MRSIPSLRTQAETSLGVKFAWAVCVLFAALPSPRAIASPSGLNNIPTADTTPDRTIVFQSYATWSEDLSDVYFLGFKMGLTPFDQKFEWGVDGRLGEEEEWLVFQVKYAVQPWEKLPAFSLGVANIATSSNQRDEAGQPDTYLVATQDLGFLRLTAGYSFQEDNERVFLGIDKEFTVFERDLILRSDFTQIDDRDQWLGSVGFIYFLDKHLAVESWVSIPFEDGEPTYTLKFDFIFGF